VAGQLEGCRAVIHLAGEPVAQRWTHAAKRRILGSRVAGTRTIVDAIGLCRQKPEVLISASGVGYYGSRGDEILTEGASPGSDFLAGVCQAWEAEARKAEAFGVRVVNPRIGLVLDAAGGALEKMLLPFKFGVGGRIGSGAQWVSWIHLSDLIGLVRFAILEPSLHGPLNAVAPDPVTNAEFTKELAAALHRPAIFPVPGLVLKLAVGEMSEMLLGSQRVLPEGAQAAGFRFRYAKLADALAEILA
jgi:uncharacterized protein (TIGR01777 family)